MSSPQPLQIHRKPMISSQIKLPESWHSHPIPLAILNAAINPPARQPRWSHAIAQQILTAPRCGLPRDRTRGESAWRLLLHLRRHEGLRRDRSCSPWLLRSRPWRDPVRHATSCRPSVIPPNEHSVRRKRGGDAGRKRSSQSLRCAPALALHPQKAPC